MNWSKQEIKELYISPLFELISKAHHIHCEHHQLGQMQVCNLINLKPGGCAEDCHYCPQAARYQTDVKAQSFMSLEEILKKAHQAISFGASRICLGVAWRGIQNGKQFELILSAAKKLSAMGVEVCCSLGLLDELQAKRLDQAGVYAYNHNLDTSENFYEKIISTRLYRQRLETLSAVAKTNITLCSGGIVGMGESDEDRIDLIHSLTTLEKTPKSIPFNFLIPVPNTPLENQPKLPVWDMVKMIATTRIVFPKAFIRLTAGRYDRSLEEQALCFFAGANSLFFGEKLLTQPNQTLEDDEQMFKLFGFTKKKSAV